MKRLVLVESHAKAKKIEAYLNEWERSRKSGIEVFVRATFGHIRDLPQRELGVDVSQGGKFGLTYEVTKGKVVRELKVLVKKVKASKGDVVLAADLDREGEAIAFAAIKVFQLPQSSPRMVFTEITKNAIIKAYLNMRRLDMDMVHAQEARRTIDRLMGYELSPVLWQNVNGRGLSAGRTQSVVLKLVCELEDRVQSFVPERVYAIKGDLKVGNSKAVSVVVPCRWQEPKRSTITDPDIMRERMVHMSKHDWKAQGTEREVRHGSAPPFTTSTLQQENRRVNRMSIKATQHVAQKLYEKGFITYIRTDSTSVSESFVPQILESIKAKWGERYLRVVGPAKTGKSRKKKKKPVKAQEAHECIRPTDMNRTHSLTGQELKLYTLIWKRTVAAFMSDQVVRELVIKATVTGLDGSLEGKLEQELFNGWKVVYEKKTKKKKDVTWNLKLDHLAFTQLRSLHGLEQRTSVLPRFNDASLVKRLESLGIGRPSTFVPSVQKNVDKGYVEEKTITVAGYEALEIRMRCPKWVMKESTKKVAKTDQKNKVVPTDLGTRVNTFLQENFSAFINETFTAEMERDLDRVASGTSSKVETVTRFYSVFQPLVAKKRGSNQGGRMKAERRVVGTWRKKQVHLIRTKFGPAVMWDKRFFNLDTISSLADIKDKDAMVALKTGLKNPYPKVIGKVANQEVRLCKGRYGLYLKCGKTTRSVPDGTKKMSLTKAKGILGL